jgi:hypothetical protein
MTETADQYKARLDAYIGDKDPIAMQREAPHTLACLIETAPDEMLSRRPAGGRSAQFLRTWPRTNWSAVGVTAR